MPQDDQIEKVHLTSASFLTSAADRRGFPPDTGLEIAVSGRSNAGKSSAINRLCGQRALARASRTPGRTQLINFFTAGSEGRRLVDLPGYGYAKVPIAVRSRWEALTRGYLEQRRSLCGLALVMDIRHPLTPGDRWIAGLCAERGLRLHVLLSKADKLKRGPAEATAHAVARELGTMGIEATVQTFSALKGSGVEEARELLTGWLAAADRPDSGQE